MGRIYKSDGLKTTLDYNGKTEEVTTNNYSGTTEQVQKIHSQEGIQMTSSQLNIEVKGNSQETCYTRGLTCESSIKVVGNPDQFDGAYYKKAHQALAQTASMLVQPPDGKKSSAMPSFPAIDLKQAIGNMSSSYAATNPPPTPHISKASDVVDYLSAVGKWFSGYVSADAAEVAARSVALEAEKQATQQVENLKAQAQETINSAEATLAGGIPAGSGATEDRPGQVEYGLDEATVLNGVNQPHLIEIERHC
jgi:hypothetical protein